MAQTTKVKATSGSTLSGIAKANGTTVAQILADNPTLAARAAAGKTVLYSGTTVKITQPSTATNPYGPTVTGQGAGLGTASVPISSVNKVLTPTTTTKSTGSTTDTGTKKDSDGDGIPDDQDPTPNGESATNKPRGTLLSTRTEDDGEFIIVIGVYADGKGGTYEGVISRTKKTTTTTTTTTTDDSGTGTNAALGSVLDQISELTKQIASMQAAAAAEAAKPKVVGVRTVRKTGGVVQTVEVMSDGSDGKIIDEYKDYGARDSVMKMFENTGLGGDFIKSLMDTIDKVYEENIMPTDAQILNSIYTSDAYKTRFAANEAIRKRMAEGKGMPGDRLLTPYEYIKTEEGYKQILAEAGLPSGFYDSQDDFTKFIENSISNAELTERVNIARRALNNADNQIVDSLKSYYGLTTGELTAYLLDKDKAFNLIDSKFRYTTEEAKKMYTSAEIGGAALRAGGVATEGGMAAKSFAEEIYKAGKEGQAESAFQTAARNREDYMRLLGLYGETGNETDLAREELALAGGTDVALKRKTLASQERAKFATRSALDQTSLTRRNKADV
jgi:hypothetical protein